MFCCSMVIADYDPYQVFTLKCAWTHKSLLNVFDLITNFFGQLVRNITIFILNLEAYKPEH
jgi:hypothetical protein